MNHHSLEALTLTRESELAKEQEKAEFTQVSIGGRVYKLKLGPGQDPEYLQKLGHFVDTKVLELKKPFPHLSHDTILMLALLNLAEQFFLSQENKPTSEDKTEHFQQEEQDLSQFFEGKVDTLQTKLETALRGLPGEMGETP